MQELTAHLHRMLELYPELNLLWAFLAGLLSSLTPCVYPLIPVTLALFGVKSGISRQRAFALSLTYVMGIALTYTILGIISARSGMLFGALLMNPVVILIICSFLIFLSLFTLEIFSLDFVYRLQTKANRVGGSGFLGAFLMGGASGLVAAPCVGPVLVVILGIAAASRDSFWGGALLFSYSLGLGVLFLVLGTFSGLLHKMPRSGDWFKIVKLVIAAGLLVVALFLLHALIPVSLVGLLRVDGIVVLIGFAIVAIFFATIGFRRNSKAAVFCGALALASAIYFGLIDRPRVATNNSWAHDINVALEQGKAHSLPVMVDLYAEWCAACKEFDSITFPDPAVTSKLASFSLARIDFTLGGDVADEISERYGVHGLPTILFLLPNGEEIPASRITGFLPPSEFLMHLSKVEQSVAKAKITED